MLRWGEGGGGGMGELANIGGGGGGEGVVVHDLAHYEVWHRMKVHSSSRHAHSHARIHSPGLTSLSLESASIHTQTHKPGYIGRRSGLSLPLAHSHIQAPSSSTVSVCLEDTHMQAHIHTSDLKQLPSLPLPLHSSAFSSPISRAQAFSARAQTEARTHIRFILTAEQVLAIGEVFQINTHTQTKSINFLSLTHISHNKTQKIGLLCVATSSLCVVISISVLA